MFVLASVTELQKTPRNFLKRQNTTLLDSSDLKIFKKQNNEKKIKKNMKDKTSYNSIMSPLIDHNDDVDNDQCSSEICESILFNNQYKWLMNYHNYHNILWCKQQ